MNRWEKERNEKEITMSSLKKRVNLVAAIALIFILIYIFLVVYRPMAQKLKDDQIKVFSLLSHLNYQTVESAFMRGVEAANSLSSRSMIRNALNDYKNRKITFEELQAYTKEKYEDGAKAIEHLIVAHRFTDGAEIACYTNQGVNDKALSLIDNQHIDPDQSETTSSILKGEYGILASIVSPISIGEIILGYDVVLYDLSEKIEKIKVHSICLEIITKEEYLELLKSSEFITEDDEITTVKKDDVYYTLGNVNEMIYIMTYETQETMFENIMIQTQIIIIFGIGFFALFGITFYTFIIKYVNSGLDKLKNSRDTYKNIAYIDSLTQAHTRSFLTIWNEAIRKTAQIYAIVLIDIDKFKHINDDFGHVTGDRVLSKMSTIFLNNIRSNDYFFRIGGDEFVLILESIPDQNINLKMNRIEKLINEIELPEGKVSISYGISHLQPGDILEKKINLADSRMYEQKKG